MKSSVSPGLPTDNNFTSSNGNRLVDVHGVASSQAPTPSARISILAQALCHRLARVTPGQFQWANASDIVTWLNHQ